MFESILFKFYLEKYNIFIKKIEWISKKAPCIECFASISPVLEIFFGITKQVEGIFFPI